MSNYVFLVSYEYEFDNGDESNFRRRVSGKKYDAQLAVDKVKADVLKETSVSEDGGRLKVVDFRLMSVDFVTDYD